MTLMREPCFDFLRTKHQLGYAVYCQYHSTDDVIGASMTVRSQCDKFSLEKVRETVNLFLKEFEEILEKMTDEEFEGRLIDFQGP